MRSHLLGKKIKNFRSAKRLLPYIKSGSDIIVSADRFTNHIIKRKVSFSFFAPLKIRASPYLSRAFSKVNPLSNLSNAAVTEAIPVSLF
ncbi:MAG: hypothetical protein LBO72_07965 [Helicobacteraceae bacterium]|jgi:hypothetical protein|nr:hypothetical protein [Helicobacteraceae bacterium]